MNTIAGNAAALGNAQYTEPPMSLHLDAQVTPHTRVHVTTTSLKELAQVMAYFNLVDAQAAPAEAPTPTAAPAAEKQTRRKTDKPENKPAAEAPKEQPAADTAGAAAGTSSPQPDAGASASTGVTPQQAGEAVRNYGAKHGIDKARELLKKHGFVKTADITADKAAAIHAEAIATEEL